MAEVALARPPARVIQPWNIVGALLLGLLGLFIVVPMGLILFNSFVISVPGQPDRFGLDGWAHLMDSRLLVPLWNTISLTVVRTAVSLPIALFVAWLLARTDIPAKGWLEFFFWLSFFLPSLPRTLGWIMLAAPDFGLLNVWAKALFDATNPFNVYSYWGIVWVHLVGVTISVKVIWLVPAFANLNAELEEASRVTGARLFDTLRRIAVPLITPTVLVVLILAIVNAWQAFEVELILGAPFHFDVYSTAIYRLARDQPPDYASATALASVVLAAMLPMVLLQRRVAVRGRFQTLSGRSRRDAFRLGSWRLPAFVFVLSLCVLLTLLPFAAMVIATLMTLFGYFDLPQVWTFANWNRVLHDSVFLSSTWNTLVIAGGSAVAAILLFPLIAYVSVRSPFRGRGSLDFVSWLPSSLPGIIVGLGLFWLTIGNPVLRPLYGTFAILIVATTLGSLTLGVQIIKSTLVQLSGELEEASRVAGAGQLQTYRRIIMPLILPVLIGVAVVTFLNSAKELSQIALLSGFSTRPLSLLQLDYMSEGRYEAAAVVGTIIALATASLAIAGRIFGLRMR